MSKLGPTRAVLVKIPIALLDRLDHAAEVLGMTRSDIIRRSLLRDIEFILQHEVERTKQYHTARETDYQLWSARKSRTNGF